MFIMHINSFYHPGCCLPVCVCACEYMIVWVHLCAQMHIYIYIYMLMYVIISYVFECVWECVHAKHHYGLIHSNEKWGGDACGGQWEKPLWTHITMKLSEAVGHVEAMEVGHTCSTGVIATPQLRYCTLQQPRNTQLHSNLQVNKSKIPKEKSITKDKDKDFPPPNSVLHTFSFRNNLQLVAFDNVIL